MSLPPIEGTSNGVVVWERVASDLGALEEPVTITVRDGRAVAVAGGASADAPAARSSRATVDADNIGEIGIGLNPAARIGDEITEAKKAFGTVHIALGDSANEYGGLVECDVHLDGLVMEPTVEFDGVPVVVGRPPRVRRRAVTAEPATAPLIVTPYPGPEARRRSSTRMRAVEGAGPRTGGADEPLVVAEAHGATLVDPDGNEFVDLAGELRRRERRPHPPRCRRGHPRPGGPDEPRLVGVRERAARRVRGGAARDRAARAWTASSSASAAPTPTTRRSSSPAR